MIPLVVAAVLLLIHALVCLVLWTLMKLGLLPVRGHMLPVIVLVPLWGPLLVVLLSVCSAVFGEGLNESALESLRFHAPPNALHAHRGARRVPGAAAGG